MLRTCLVAGAGALVLTLCAQATLAQVASAAPAAPAVATPWDALTQGAPIIEIRPRYEEVDQAKTKTLTHDAEAYTVRLHFGWRTADWNGFQALVEGADISAIGPERFAVNVPGATTPPLNGAGKAKYPLVNDPAVAELNRAQITWSPNALISTTVGRQIIDIDDQRFVGDVNWRQDQQTFDGVRGDLHFGQVRLFVAYLDRVNRTLAEYRDFRSDSYLINARYDVGKSFDLEAFEYLLDFGNSAINSSQTRGVRASGGASVGPVALAYDAAYAHQSDYANAPSRFGLDFYAADLSATYGWASLRLDREQLNGNGKHGFTTPLATTHSFQGWADAFVSPGGNKSFADGIIDQNISLAIRPPMHWGPFSKPEFLVRAYDFKDERFASHLGREWDMSASVNVADKVSVLLKYADFRRDASVPVGAATPPPSRNKVWLMLDFKL